MKILKKSCNITKKITRAHTSTSLSADNVGPHSLGIRNKPKYNLTVPDPTTLIHESEKDVCGPISRCENS